MKGGALVVVGALCAACGNDGGLAYDGIAGHAMPADFQQWVPGLAAQVSGRDVTLLFDSGSPLTLLDTDTVPGFTAGMHAVDLALGDLDIHGVDAAAFDVFSYDQSRRPPLDGIVGGDVLAHFAYSLDYQGGRVWLEDGGPAPLPEGESPDAVGAPVSIPAEVAGGGGFLVPGCDARGGSSGCQARVGATRFLVRAEAEDQNHADAFWVLVDTGATSVVLSSPVMDQLGADSRPRLDGVTVGTASGEQTAYLTRVWSLRLVGDASSAPADLDSVPVLVLPTDDLFASLSAEVGRDVRGVVGGSFLRWYLTTLDYPDQELRLLPYRDPAHIDPDEFVGPGFELAASGADWVVDTVYPGTDAAAQGLAPGQVVDQVAGTDLAGLSAAEVQALLAPYREGDEVPVVVEQAGGPVALSIKVEDLLPPYEAP